MTQIAHLSDLHLLEEGHARRTGLAKRRLSVLSLGRPESAERRRRRAEHALREALHTGARHLVITGDLTEDGVPEQFEALAELLDASGWPAGRVTLVPGNHDVYAHAGAFEEALRGPLAPYRATSTMGAPVFLPGLVLVPVSTAIHQPVTRAAGAIEGVEIEAIERAAEASRLSGAALLVAMHHAPQRRSLLPMQWLEGLRDHAAMTAVLDRFDHAHVIHGHTHAGRDRAARPGGTPRIFSVAATVEGRASLRVYEARHGRLWPEVHLHTSEPSLAAA